MYEHHSYHIPSVGQDERPLALQIRTNVIRAILRTKLFGYTVVRWRRSQDVKRQNPPSGTCVSRPNQVQLISCSSVKLRVY